MTTNTNNATNPTNKNAATPAANPAPSTPSTQSSTLNGIAGALWTELNKLIALLVQLEQISQSSVKADIDIGFSETDHVADSTRKEASSNASSLKADAWAALATAGLTLAAGAIAIGKTTRLSNDGRKLTKINNEMEHLEKINRDHFLNPNAPRHNIAGDQPDATHALTPRQSQRLEDLAARPSAFNDCLRTKTEGTTLWKEDKDIEVFNHISADNEAAIKANLDKRMENLQTQKTGIQTQLSTEMGKWQIGSELARQGSTAVTSNFKAGYTIDAAEHRADAAIENNMASQASQMNSQMSSVRDKAADAVTSNIQQLTQTISGMYRG